MSRTEFRRRGRLLLKAVKEDDVVESVRLYREAVLGCEGCEVQDLARSIPIQLHEHLYAVALTAVVKSGQ